ncbi:MAG: cytochrome P450 [Phenylobacterium sp.]|uniref:cytochrome P450 n=1 Tax=Phenylobacterium sp. TaxID=1871053 RepID=UPI0027279378|nr:cytochrome P450 [Phenylobacterium sp.]MDO9430861.1 cytochrome P450 [Phenylobacterium sp.]
MSSIGVRIPDDHARNLIDPTAYADGRIHETYAWLRANNPFGLAEVEGFDPFWVATKHADILEISRQNALFHSGDRSTVITNKAADTAVRAMMGGSPHLVRSLVQMDAPDHPKYRALTQAWFMPPNIKGLEDRIRGIARKAVDKMAATGGECDFISAVALHYPLHVIMEILGVPEADEQRMLTLTQELFGATDPELGRKSDREADLTKLLSEGVVADFYAYFAKLSADRRANPTDDLATVIATSEIDGQPISELEAMSYYMIVATAGHDTTSSTTAGALWALAENPEQFAKVKANPALIPGLIEESIRWVTPVKHFMRTATADADLAGRKIAKGDWMMLSYPSGNRDEAVFTDPFKFDVERTPNKHVAFGYGAHVCLGQHLARMEMRILWEELFARLESVELDGAPRNMAASFVCGPKSVPIRFKMH